MPRFRVNFTRTITETTSRVVDADDCIDALDEGRCLLDEVSCLDGSWVSFDDGNDTVRISGVIETTKPVT